MATTMQATMSLRAALPPLSWRADRRSLGVCSPFPGLGRVMEGRDGLVGLRAVVSRLGERSLAVEGTVETFGCEERPARGREERPED